MILLVNGEPHGAERVKYVCMYTKLESYTCAAK